MSRKYIPVTDVNYDAALWRQGKKVDTPIKHPNELKTISIDEMFLTKGFESVQC